MLKTRTLHTNWQFSAQSWLDAPDGWYGYSKLEWLPAHVPGHVHLDLLQSGVISDPFQNLQELGTRWVDEEDWFYRCEFEFEPDAARPRTALSFAGLDTVATVLLNGKVVLESDNMFVGYDVDVTSAVQAGKNSLEVRFKAALAVGRERREAYFKRDGLPLDTVHFEERAFVRKAQYMFGWDWGPRLISVGIWGRVELTQYSARLRNVRIEQHHQADGSVELEFHSEHEGTGEVVHLIEGVPGVVRDGQRARIAKPELWWPVGLGAQRLYNVTSLLVPNAGAAASTLEASALDRKTTRIGLRQIRLLREADKIGESFEFECNGRRIYSVGANWIPDSSYPGAVSREQVRSQVARAVSLNMNMLRVWGGGVYESEDFYDVCDELGVLVWQDFPYGCSFYPDDAEWQQRAYEEAKSAIRRLYNRPSLAIWCGNNENLTMWQDKWTDAKRHPPRYYGENIYEKALPKALAELDSSRPYIATSPIGGERANGGDVGDQHYWDVWHGRGDWKFYEDSTARFASEFGFASAPGRATLSKLASSAPAPLALPLRDLRARWHDKTRKGYETFVAYTELHYPVSETLEDWLYFSQLNQRDALRHGIEHYRRSEFCKGSLIWQLNDCWPVQSWAVVDSDFELKAAAYELRRLYAPAMLSLEKLEGKVRLWAVLDNASAGWSGEVVLTARSLTDGRTLSQARVTPELKVGERRVVLELDTSALAAETTVVVAEHAGRNTFRLLAEPKQSKFPKAQVRATLHGSELTLESDVPVVDLYLWDEAASSELSVSDNFITLAAGESRTLTLSGPVQRLRARSLAGRHELVVHNA
ncbi:MAG: glycoside hydrolase family 2 TIM barrel-domain containing protein [Polyangiaceae bacterium]